MKTKLIFTALLYSFIVNAQQQYAGLLNSNRVNLLQATKNPAELMNIEKDRELLASNFNFQFSNNKISSKDIFSGSDLEKIIFDSNEDISAAFSTQFTTLGYGMKFKRFAFSVSSNTYANFNIDNINSKLGDAIINSGGSFYSHLPLNIQANELQRINLAMYTDIAIGGAVKVLNFDNHKLNFGFNAKLIFPSTYLNIGISNLNANLTPVNQNVNALTATGDINMSYSGTDGFQASEMNPLKNMSFQNLNSVVTDFGINYQFYKSKDSLSVKNNDYLLNFGATYTGVGKVKYKKGNTTSRDYSLNVMPNAQNPSGLDLSAIGNLSSVDDIYNMLQTNNFLSGGSSQTEIEINLPAQLNLYADVRILRKLYASVYYQKSVAKTNSNYSISNPDYITFSPRFRHKKIEVFTPITNNSLSGTSVGFGCKLGSFYMSSGSAISMAVSNTKQLDLSIGFSKGF